MIVKHIHIKNNIFLLNEDYKLIIVLFW